jgi:hypothetical protein
MNKYLGWIVAVLLGAGAGFLYWYFIGCNSGSCAITSSPVNSTLYGAVFGALLKNSFSTRAKNGDVEKS